MAASTAVCAQGTDSVTITADDSFNQPGLYFLAYSNDFDPTNPTPISYSTRNIQGTSGPGQIWDFSTGPTNLVWRYDYLSPASIDAEVIASFPEAKVVEKQVNQTRGNEAQYLFFEQIANEGRQVYGFYANLPLFGEPVNRFAPPIVDFPARMTLGDKWHTSTVYSNTVVVSVDPTDPEGEGFSIDVLVTQTSEFEADATGTIILPNELNAFGPGLRINEQVTIDIQYLDDSSNTYQPLETDYARNFYWMMPGRGIVAGLFSTQNSDVLGGNAGMPPENFTRATQFWRLFETNKKVTPSTGGCTSPEAVQDLRIRVSAGQVLLSWTKANCATQYRLDYSTNPVDKTSWKTLTTLTNKVLALDSMAGDSTRFYRVVSVK